MDDFKLSPEAILAGHRLETYQSVGSTNQLGSKAARDGKPGNLWIVADKQTAGKGRHGRKWQTAPGNLAASVFVCVSKHTSAPHLLGFVAAIAIAKTIESLLGPKGPEISLKWPNDVLLNKAKLAGILLEALPMPDDKRAIVIGMGINVSSSPQGLPYATACLNQFNPDIIVSSLFTLLTRNWVQTCAIWKRENGRKTILKQWRELVAGIGRPVTVNCMRESLSGTFSGIDHEGRMILSLANGEKKTITAGDVEF